MSYDLSMEDLSQYFHLPINDVAKELGVCATVLKKICRKKGIKRWPHRKIKSLNNMIADLERIVASNASDRAALAMEIETLKEKREFLLRNPNVSYKSVVPKYCVSSCQTRVNKAVSSGEVQPAAAEDVVAASARVSPAESRATASAAAQVGSKRKRSGIDPGQEENAVSVLLGLLRETEDEAPLRPHPASSLTAPTASIAASMRNSFASMPSMPLAHDSNRMAVEESRAHSRSGLIASSEAVSLIGHLPGMVGAKPAGSGMDSAAAASDADVVHASKRRKLFDDNSAPYRSLPPIHPFSSMQPMHPFTASSSPVADFRVVPCMGGHSPVHSPM